MEISTVGSFTLGWGESVIWDDRRGRLWFVDCAARTLHWLDDEEGPLGTMTLPTMASAVVPTVDDLLVAVLEDGLAVVDVDQGSVTPIADYPDGLGGRANDACADLAGNLITGRLNFAPAPGSTWRFEPGAGWTLLDDDISNTNGPTVGVIGGEETLVIGDTAADYFAATYSSATGSIGPRRVFGDASGLDGRPDGATLDADGGLWCAMVGGAQVVRFTTAGLDRTVPVPVDNPTDVTFGGPGLDRLYVTSTGGDGHLDGRLLSIAALGAVGRPEPRVALR